MFVGPPVLDVALATDVVLARSRRRVLLEGACADLSLAPGLRREAWREVAALDRLLGVDSDVIAAGGV